MIYRAIGLMSGSSLDGLDIVFVEFLENGGNWQYEVLHSECVQYSEEWVQKLCEATTMSAVDYLLLHTAYGKYLGNIVNEFINKYNLQFKVALIASHGHTVFHFPQNNMTAQLGDGAAIAAATQLPVVTDLRALDVAFGGQGAPIVPIGEKLLLQDFDFCLNIGGIANISFNRSPFRAFDVCAANRVLNMLAAEVGADYDEGGKIARSGSIHLPLLEELSSVAYYRQLPPKSLANSFGTDIIYPIVKKYNLITRDALCTYITHIAEQIKNAISINEMPENERTDRKLLATGGGALNIFLIETLSAMLAPFNIRVVVPNEGLVLYKEAIIMALMGVLRWREEYNVMRSVTGAARDSVGGAMWMGQEE